MHIKTDQRLPSAIWAWEGLRRNPDYRRSYFASQFSRPRRVRLSTGAILLRANQRQRRAESFGLLSFSDPDNGYDKAELFWRPDLLAGSLQVALRSPQKAGLYSKSSTDPIILSKLKARRTILQTVDGMRHILISGTNYWLQLYSFSTLPVGEEVVVQIRIDNAKYGMRRLDAAAQLLSLHRSSDENPSLIGRQNTPQSVVRALRAFDIYNGFECPKGDLKTVARSLVGRERVEKDWGHDRNLRVQSRRWVERGDEFVKSRYREFLTRKSL